jgi:hypothetical protein
MEVKIAATLVMMIIGSDTSSVAIDHLQFSSLQACESAEGVLSVVEEPSSAQRRAELQALFEDLGAEYRPFPGGIYTVCLTDP